MAGQGSVGGKGVPRIVAHRLSRGAGICGSRLFCVARTGLKVDVMRKPAAAVGSVLFFVAAPGTVAGLIPWWITHWEIRTPIAPWTAARVVGGLLLVAGLAVLISAFARFVGEGLGTPMPAAAPTRLVVGGLYRYVRNPMYVAVLAIIIGQALLLGQLGLLLYAVVVWLGPAAFVRWYEEPVLLERFGKDSEAYRRGVPAWLPRLRPSQQDPRPKTTESPENLPER